MPSVNALYKFNLDTNTSVSLGDGKTTVSIALTNGTAFHIESLIVADNFTKKTLWTTGQGGLATFEWGLLVSDKDVFIELRNDDSGTPEYMNMFCKANVPVYIPPQFGGSTAARLDGADLIDNTDYADTDRIEVQRDVADAIGDAKIKLFLFN